MSVTIKEVRIGSERLRKDARIITKMRTAKDEDPETLLKIADLLDDWADENERRHNEQKHDDGNGGRSQDD